MPPPSLLSWPRWPGFLRLLRLPPAWATLRISALVGLAYVLSGKASMAVTLPPNYVSLVFLPAGVALGAVLIWGGRALPGVLLGSVAVQWQASGQAVVAGGDWPLTLWFSPLGAVGQAWLTAWVARRWLHYPDAFDEPRRIIWLLLVLVPLGHAINAGVSVPLLVQSAVIAPADMGWSFLTWWQGDVMGALLGAPLMLVAFGQPAEMWRHRWKTVSLPMLGALAVVMAAFLQLQASEQRSLEQRFQQEARVLTDRLQRRLEAQTDAVLSVTRLMELGADRSASEFELATSLWLRRYQGTQNMGWSPLVRHSERAEFEHRMRDVVGPGGIRGRDTSGALFSAPPSPTYLPIVYVQPRAPNRAVRGLDVQALPATALTAQAAMVSGLPHVSEGMRLVQEVGEQRGVVMYQAAFPPGMGRRGVPTAPALGVVSAVFRMDDVLQSALGPQLPAHFRWCLLDPGAGPDNQRLSGAPGCGGAGAPTSRYLSALPVRFGERTWTFQLSSGPDFERITRGWVAWGTLSVSLLAVTLLGVFLMVLSGQARRTEQLVVARTRQLAQSNAGLQQLAMFDPLTGLANRLHWLNEAGKALDSARRHGDRLAVAFVDLDHFKNVNDSLGHSVGDLLLRTVAQRLQACVRAHDLLARQGGDEFVGLLTRLQQPSDAAAVAHKMAEVLSQTCVLQGREVAVSASIGLVWFDSRDNTDSDVETLLRQADVAMYRAKDAGRNGWCFFEPGMDEPVTQRLMVEHGLRRALAPGELVLHYQPTVSARAGRVVGVEALVRWQHPDEGLLMPDRFIAQAEQSGQIEAVGAWVLRQACQQWCQWEASGVRGLTMAVNVSAVEFSRPGFVQRVRQTLQDTGIRPSALALEITETALMQALPDLVERLGELAAMGLRLSLDDFGTGYSSLSYLKRLPLHQLKIDRSFVRGLPGDKGDVAIVRATLSMAHALGLEVVAEGVEHEHQRLFLAENGCEQLQGWLVSKALPSADFVAWWQAQQPPPAA